MQGPKKINKMMKRVYPHGAYIPVRGGDRNGDGERQTRNKQTKHKIY
jgi:hypothetical protein